jgi:large subunit ribosomal protein L14
MKALSTRITRSLPVGANLICADNTGAKIVRIISVRGFKGCRRTKPAAGVGGWISVKVIKGDEKVRHEVHKAVIIRQRRDFRRANGMRVSFEDNACVLISDKGEARGSMIKGPVAKEAIERFPTIGKIAGQVV